MQEIQVITAGVESKTTGFLVDGACVMMLGPAVSSHPPTTKWFPRSAVPVRRNTSEWDRG